MDLEPKHPRAQRFTFGDNRQSCDALLALVRSGQKTATCGALSDFETGQEAMPEPGRHDIALDWAGVPQLLIRTTDVCLRRFCDVDGDFALAEGETGSLDGWRADHRADFTRNGGWSPEMMLVCEQFELVEDLGKSR